jgi:hypothetical protein
MKDGVPEGFVEMKIQNCSFPWEVLVPQRLRSLRPNLSVSTAPSGRSAWSTHRPSQRISGFGEEPQKRNGAQRAVATV